MSLKNPEKSLEQSKSHWFRSMTKETNCKLFRPSTNSKRMFFLKQKNSATPIQLCFKELCGGFCPYTLVSEQDMKVVSYAGWPSEAQRPDMVRRGDTKEYSNQRFMPLIQQDVLSVFTKNSAVEMNTTESPFYLAVRHNQCSNEKVWFMKAPLGKNKIGKFLSTAAKNAGLHREGKQVINHSVRKSCISWFLDADVPDNFVAQLNGHKSTESLQSYKSTSAKHQKRMSLTLSRADLSRSRDEAFSSVHNQRFEVVTCLTTDVAARSTTISLIDQWSDSLLSTTAPVFKVAKYFMVMWKLSRINGSIELLSRAMRTIDFGATFCQLCPVLNWFSQLQT